MIRKEFTPAQSYAARIIVALDNLLKDTEDIEAQDEVLMMILERPKTLLCALSAYLYKSLNR